MIDEIETGRRVATEVRPVKPSDVKHLETGWRFDWSAGLESVEVYKIIASRSPGEILGLLGLRRQVNYVEVTLLESRPGNVGRTKRFRGIPGNLFAFAAQLSFAIGGDGFIVIDAKTELVDHFRRVYGFERIGHSQRMILAPPAAARLISQYGGSSTHE